MQLLVYINVVYEQEDRYTYTQVFISEMLSVLYTYTDKETHYKAMGQFTTLL